jgi:hypothetical protein|tara:strand:- start:222 stop:1598 length:1377 start_codon:yes stop_codon:yes gene_type:complete
MKKLFTMLFTITCFLTYATDLYVFPGGTSPNYSSIHTAVNAAADGDRVLVAPGTYIENVSMPATNLTIIPLADGGNYTISGSFSITATYDGKRATIVGAIVHGDFEEINNTSNSCSGSQINEFNIINCEFLQDFNPQRCLIINLYYSTLHLNGSQYYGMYKEMIGNYFINTSGTEKNLYCFVIDSDWNTAADALYGDDQGQKVYGNHFENVCLKYTTWGSDPHWTEELHIANNFFEYNIYQAGTYKHLDLSLSSTSNPASMLIENNTFERTASTQYNTSGWGISLSGQYGSAIIRNNAFFSDQNNWNSSNYPLFYFYMSDGIGVVTNNLFGNGAYSTTLTTGNLTSPQNSYFGGTLSGGSVNAADNFFNSSFSNSEIGSSSGIVTASLAINNGFDIMECRDVDDTQNDIGTWGGPHSWDNYHSTSTGKGRIIDIQMPSTIYGLPGVTFEVKSKAIRTN